MHAGRSIGLIGAAVAAGTALAGPTQISWYTLDGGGGTSTGGTMQLSGTIGQADAGVLSGGPFSLYGGFWPGPTDSCYADCNADGLLTVADFGCFQTKFVLGNLYADCNGDGALSVADFGCFQTKFVLGCP